MDVEEAKQKTAEIIQEVADTSFQDGHAEGWNEGFNEGHEEGYEEGYQKGCEDSE